MAKEKGLSNTSLRRGVFKYSQLRKNGKNKDSPNLKSNCSHIFLIYVIYFTMWLQRKISMMIIH